MVLRFLMPVISFLGKTWVKWTVLTVLSLVLLVVHLVMYAEYGNTPEAPTWQFTLSVHLFILLFIVALFYIYNRFLKQKLIDYGTNDKHESDTIG